MQGMQDQGPLKHPGRRPEANGQPQIRDLISGPSRRVEYQIQRLIHLARHTLDSIPFSPGTSPGTVPYLAPVDNPSGIDRTLAELLPERTGDLETDIRAASREVTKRAEDGHRIYHSAGQMGGQLVRELRDRGYSWHQVTMVTGFESRTARRWYKLVTEQPPYQAVNEKTQP